MTVDYHRLDRIVTPIAAATPDVISLSANHHNSLAPCVQLLLF